MLKDLIFSQFFTQVSTENRHNFREVVGLENPLSANHNAEFQCLICFGVTLFALVVHSNCTALSQSELSIFFMYTIISETVLT